MKQWEYFEGQGCIGGVEYKEGNRKKQITLNELGKQGWELFHVTESGGCLFKREIVNAPTQTVEPVKKKPAPSYEEEYSYQF